MPEPVVLSVFIIDDNETTRAILRMIIQGENYHVIGEANNGISGLARARRLRPDIVCLDIEMPDSNGLDILIEIKQTLPNTAVLMVTGNNDRATIVTAIQRGASGFILKPFNSGVVLDTLNKAAAFLKSHLKK
ncbi:response regulator [Janthinobacterium sp. UMAB-56]|uniref:response regulator n=1 Tax=Janthinobacterium sp. UMAB-56 TaxID=1365361 RepID=UPI00214CF9A3|nr:response regulator [Janthinobacterium sp. UMAB-56]